MLESDKHLGSDTKGGVEIDLIYRSLAAMEIEGGYRGIFGGGKYLVPAAEGGTEDIEADERMHRGHLGLRYDVLRTVDVPLHLEPYAGVAYNEINSKVYTSKFFGGGGGLRFGYEPDPRVAIDMSGGILGGGDFGKTTNDVLGPVKPIWEWGAGVVFRPSRPSSCRAFA